jgi:hypothetical protein
MSDPAVFGPHDEELARRALRDYLDEIGPGDIPSDHHKQVTTLVTAIWDGLEGSRESSMEARKLARIEAPRWEPPLLGIERHGAVAMGGTRAEVYRWTVDLDTMTADITDARSRQLYPMADRFYAKPVAAELVQIVLRHGDDPRLKWSAGKSDVRLVMKAVVPDDGYKQTVAGRRLRMRDEFCAAMTAAGWELIPGTGPRWYRDASSALDDPSV